MNNITINFLLQSIRILHVGGYSEDELEMIYKFTVKVDNDLLFYYLSSNTILSYESDLELFIEIIDGLISIYEVREEYEKCVLLKNKKEESIKILNK
jgi:hypothetical protein